MNQRYRRRLSPHFMLYCFIRNGKAFDHKVENMPDRNSFKALENLCHTILEPLWQHFGPVVVARGFMSRQTAYFTNVDTMSDYCRGEGVDIVCGGRDRGHFMYQFIKKNLNFDELYMLPSDDNPEWLHVSYRSTGKNRKLAK